jgi:hypothetical protein
LELKTKAVVLFKIARPFRHRSEHEVSGNRILLTFRLSACGPTCEVYTSWMKVEYLILSASFNVEIATHKSLMDKVNEKIGEGYDLLGPPFFGPEALYQAMTRRIKPE